jgi:GT2 family glycosyltransferase
MGPQENDSNLAVCILFFERLNQTINCIQSFQNPDVNLYILNNGSSHANHGALRAFCSNYDTIRLFDSQINIGVARGRNFLVNHTTEDWLLFVDNDIIVKTLNWLETFRGHATGNPDIEVWVPRVYNLHDRRYAWHRSIRISDGRAIHDLEAEDDSFNTFPGGSSFVRRSLFRRLGLYDEEIFVGFEDFELCIRGILEGNPVRAKLIRDMEFWHDHQKPETPEDRKATVTRYDVGRIDQSCKRILFKHNLVFDADWKGWIARQLEKTLK